MDTDAIAALAYAAGIPIAPQRLQGVADTYNMTMEMAARVAAVDLPAQTLENAPVFNAWAESAE